MPANGSLPPLANATQPVIAYNIEYDSQWYLLEVSHFDPGIPARAHYLRIGSLGLGLLFGVSTVSRTATA